MSVPDIYSRRNKVNDPKDLYCYDKIPEKLKIQVMYISEDMFGNGISLQLDNFSGKSSKAAWKDFENFILREWAIPTSKKLNPKEHIEKIISSPDFTVSNFLDYCEMIFIKANGKRKEIYQKKTKEESISELNQRFIECGFGYQYESNKIIRIDNHLIHREVIIPTLSFLSNPLFHKSDADYRLAHEHYKNHNVKDCIIACGRSFESMMKAICDDKGWSYPAGVRASDLVTTLRNEGLFQDGADKGFNAFVAMLKTGVPDLRNAIGGHGEAPNTPEPILYMASYALHLTATNLLFLANSWKISV
ncbi:hypothetical protein AA14337_1420 [Acetobacter malorum DSM 14337]|uniref:Abortive infection protein-like C-terminal domain-containing protein n=1 Tax=Acetobacter malorum DSM 14337 TaxID=1307910 RepID=A0ABQ0PS94_9PROT|nr:hypothetical protein [Acetobacter malorum]GBQ79330.1 hypothetical protein AA14337_1420 [Acetobacter malorum DSM 14337]